jgi:MFS superfamily sulfate permease-like transporter
MNPPVKHPSSKLPRFELRYDLPASVVVFLVALPLCLGIALASGAPLVAGLVAGIVGGLVVGSLSGSPLAVSGPAAGLTVVVLDAIQGLGSYEAFLVAGLLAGAMQIGFGYLRAGTLGDFFPTAVIRGMLAGIGLILILKQLPHAVGWDTDYLGDESFAQDDGETTFSAIGHINEHISWGAALIAVVGLAVLILWEQPKFKQSPALRLVPGPLVAVLSGVGLNQLFTRLAPALAVSESHRVSVPRIESFEGLRTQLFTPDFSAIASADVWVVAVTLTIIASLETLLSVDASDRLDPQRRLTPKNRELKAQGVGNMVSSLLGGLPLTAVIVRSSANVVAGARTKLSAVLHGAWLLLSVLLLANALALIPLASLAAILLFVGFKLTPPALYKRMYRDGWSQFVPFLVTIVAMVLTNLLVGVLVGLVVGTFYVFHTNFKTAVYTLHEGNRLLIRFQKDVSFLNKAKVRQVLEGVQPGTEVVIDTSESVFVDHDIQQTLDDFCALAPERNISVERRGGSLNGNGPETRKAA